MSNRTRTLSQTPVSTRLSTSDNTTPNTIEVSISYKEGGRNPRSFVKEERGYYLTVSPKNIGNLSRGTLTTVIGQFSSPTVIIEPAKRFGQRKLDNITPKSGVIDQLVAQVMINNNLKFNKPIQLFAA